MKMPITKNTVLLIFQLSAALTALTSCGGRPQAGGPGAGGPTGPVPYKTAEVYAGPATMFYSYPATVQGEQNVEIRPKVDGFIQNIFVDEGATVHKGQPLFVLRNPQYEAAVRSAVAAVKIAEADVQTAEMDVEKVRPLVERKIISDYELQSKQYALNSKKASLASARAELINANVNVGYTYLTSPSNGVIGTIPYKVGSLVSSTSANPLTTVYNTNNIYVYFSLNEKQLLEFSRTLKGATLKEKLATMADVSLILADGTEYPEKGRIVTVSGLISTETGSVSFRADFPNKPGLILSGSSATIKVPVQIENALLIPQNATYDMQGQKFVYTLNDKDSTVNTGISVSANPIGNLYVVESGLKKGDKIVVEGVGNLRPGMAVKPLLSNPDSLYADAGKSMIHTKL